MTQIFLSMVVSCRSPSWKPVPAPWCSQDRMTDARGGSVGFDEPRRRVRRNRRTNPLATAKAGVPATGIRELRLADISAYRWATRSSATCLPKAIV